MNIKYGLKLWSINTNLIEQAVQLIDEKIFDYIELFVIPDSQINHFEFDIPYVIHIPHNKFGVNIGDSKLKKYNLEKINESIKWANQLNAEYLVLHAECGSIDSAKNLLSDIHDNRILIENMPKIGLDGEMMIGYLPEQIEELIKIGDFGFCLDFGHAIKASISLKMNYKNILQRFIKLNPKVFHISDGNFDIEKDEHLNIGSGMYDFRYFKNLIYKNSSKIVTLETPRKNNLSLDDDVKNIEALNLFWKNERT